MRRKRPYEACARKAVPERVKRAILVRQEGCCADCGTRLALGRMVFDHRPPLAMREAGDDANDPDRIAAICQSCDRAKTPGDLRAIARTKRLAEEHQAFVERQAHKVPGRRAPSQREWEKMSEYLNHGSTPPRVATYHAHIYGQGAPGEISLGPAQCDVPERSR